MRVQAIDQRIYTYPDLTIVCRSITSLQEYILIAQHTPYVQRYIRQTFHFWHIHLANTIADQITLETVGCTLRLQDIYIGIDLLDS